MTTKHKYIYLLSTAALVAIHFLGRWLMSLYGLDPPYIYFNVGMLLYVGSLMLGIVLALVVFAHILKDSRRRSG